jgi:uncharacterized repeat protein (TIGR03803 family)
MRWLAMQRTEFPSFVRQSLTILALTATLIAPAWAQPKFKILATAPGGLFSGLTFDAKGNLYGVTGAGGDDNQGTIFELTPGAHGWALHTLHSFDGQHGGSPNGGLIFDAAGNFYGTALGGPGLQDGGLVYEMMRKANGWTFDVLYDFCLQYHCPDGGTPQSGVILDASGNLYGTTPGGGEYGGGTVFELTSGSDGWGEDLLYSFCSKAYCRDGQAPIAGVIADDAGNFYGTTFRGGAYGGGSVFRLKRAAGGAWSERVLYSFCLAGFPLCKDGQRAYAGVVFDGAGNLYGTTEQGGGNTCGETSCGTVYKLTPTRSGGWRHTVLYAFPNPADGSFPTGGVVVDKAGNLYGATVAGGIGGCSGGCGVAYKLARSASGKWTYTVLHKFDGSDGAQPLGGLIFDGKGNLYGTAYSVVFEITP